jgi:hypothetical protein
VLLLLLENRDTNLDASTIKQGINHNRQFSQAEVTLTVYLTYTTVHHHIQRDMIAVSLLQSNILFIWLVPDGWCWFVLREKYCSLVADKPSEQGVSLHLPPFRGLTTQPAARRCQPLPSHPFALHFQRDLTIRYNATQCKRLRASLHPVTKIGKMSMPSMLQCRRRSE